MSTGAYRTDTYSDNNYRLNRQHSPLRRDLEFALKGSVLNEIIHTIGSAVTGVCAVSNFYEGGPANNVLGAVLTAAFSVEASLVALQRYNRARLIHRADEALRDGVTFTEGYTFTLPYANYLGIDETAYEKCIELGIGTAAGPTPPQPGPIYPASE